FGEPELVEIGYFVALTMGQQRWLRTLGIEHHQILAGTDASMAPGFETADALEHSKQASDYWAKTRAKTQAAEGLAAMLSSPRKRGPITTASGIWVPAFARTTASNVKTGTRHTCAKPRGNECSRSTPAFVISKSSPVCTPALPSRVTTLG